MSASRTHSATRGLVVVVALLLVGACGLGEKFDPTTLDRSTSTIQTDGAATAGAPADTPFVPPDGTMSNPDGRDAGDFLLLFEDPDEERSRPIADDLRSSRVFESLIDVLNRRYNLPHDIGLIFQDGTGPAYLPRRKVIAFDYGVLAQVRRAKRLLNPDAAPDQINLEVRQVAAFIFFHEMGHALIDAYDLPITGREEDAADQLATVVAIESLENPEVALAGAQFFSLLARARDMPPTLEDFADEHSLDQQRVINIACWVVGADPRSRLDLGQIRITRDRLDRCPDEWKQASRAWNRLLGPFEK